MYFVRGKLHFCFFHYLSSYSFPLKSKSLKEGKKIIHSISRFSFNLAKRSYVIIFESISSTFEASSFNEAAGAEAIVAQACNKIMTSSWVYLKFPNTRTVLMKKMMHIQICFCYCKTLVRLRHILKQGFSTFFFAEPLGI